MRAESGRPFWDLAFTIILTEDIAEFDPFLSTKSNFAIFRTSRSPVLIPGKMATYPAMVESGRIDEQSRADWLC